MTRSATSAINRQPPTAMTTVKKPSNITNLASTHQSLPQVPLALAPRAGSPYGSAWPALPFIGVGFELRHQFGKVKATFVDGQT